jgi:hypothetical protein
MANVTYLLGAGASAGTKMDPALPISGKIAESLQNLPDAVRLNIMSMTSEVSLRPPPEGSTGAALIDGIKYLKGIAETHPSLDTYARKLFLRNGPDDEKEIKKFKAAISCYFVLLQTMVRMDQRYDHFFASTLNPLSPGKPILPMDVNILSWNYDTQLERSFRDFTTSPDYVFEGLSRNRHLLRLNGVCISPEPKMKEFWHLCFDKFNPSTLAQVDRLYRMLLDESSGLEPQIHFAWESDYYDSFLKDPLWQICSSTEVLVVIGYSFPYFNHGQDALNLSMSLVNGPLKRIYVQAPKENHASIGERLNEMVPKGKATIEFREGLDLFFLPEELDRTFSDVKRQPPSSEE